MKRSIKRGLFASVADSNFQKFILPNSDDLQQGFRWIEENEFLLNGKMYDVISRSTQNDSTVIIAVNDKQEEELTAKYKSDIQKVLNEFLLRSSKSIGAKLLCHAPNNPISVPDLPQSEYKFPNCSFSNNPSSIIIDIPIPPPKRLI